MNLPVPIVALLASLVCFHNLQAQSPENVDKLVRAYFTAYQAQEWETVVSMLHPETLEGMRIAILAKIPRTSDAITDEKRQDIEGLLKTLSVKRPEDAWALPPKTITLRILNQSREIPAVNVLKDAITEIKDVKIEEDSGEYHVEVEVESKFNRKIYSGTTYFVIAPFEGALKVVSMTKAKRPPKDDQSGTGQPATRPESKAERSDKPQPEAEGRSR